MVRAKLKGPPLWPGGPTPRRIATALRRGLAPKPKERWPTLDSLLEVLAEDTSDVPRKRWLWTMTASAVVVAGSYASKLWGAALLECGGEGPAA